VLPRYAGRARAHARCRCKCSQQPLRRRQDHPPGAVRQQAPQRPTTIPTHSATSSAPQLAGLISAEGRKPTGDGLHKSALQVERLDDVPIASPMPRRRIHFTHPPARTCRRKAPAMDFANAVTQPDRQPKECTQYDKKQRSALPSDVDNTCSTVQRHHASATSWCT
jgi:hypothetical protein